MNIHIPYNFKDNPWGGANQFLKGVKKYFLEQGVYSESPYKADVVLFNSHHNIDYVLKLKKRFNSLIFIHRIDGPIFVVRDRDIQLDKIVFRINNYVANGTIFQSNWSRQENYRLGLKKKIFETVIINAADPLIFNRNGKIPFSKDRIIRLIATSWSRNWKKGFHVYQWLDENMDFEKYEMTFIGNSPIQFKNIQNIQPVLSHELALKLKENDIFITASQKDPCSNSLIEALHCGLPALVRNDGGHPEILGKGGILFNKPEEIPLLLKYMIDDYSTYQRQINLPTMNEVGKAYYDFMKNIYKAKKKGIYKPKRLDWKGTLRINIPILFWKMKGHIRSFFR